MSLTFNEFYADLVSALSDNLPDDFFTLQQFMEDANLTEMTARRRLRARVDSGELGTKLATVDGYERRCFWQI